MTARRGTRTVAAKTACFRPIEEYPAISAPNFESKEILRELSHLKPVRKFWMVKFMRVGEVCKAIDVYVPSMLNADVAAACQPCAQMHDDSRSKSDATNQLHCLEEAGPAILVEEEKDIISEKSRMCPETS